MKQSKKIIIVFLSVLLFFGVLYIGFAFYYSHPFNALGVKNPISQKSFTYGTVINDIYCTGLSVDDLENTLSNNVEIADIKINTKDGSYVISAADIGLRADFSQELDELLNNQKSLLWGANLVSIDKNEISPSYVFDEAAFDIQFNKLNIAECNNASNDVYIELSDDGYVLTDNKNHYFDVDGFKEVVLEKINQGVVDIYADDSFYTEPVYSADETNLISFYDELLEHQNREVVYHFGSEEKKISGYDWDSLYIKADKLPQKFSNYNSIKDAFDFEIDEEKAINFIDEFLDEYNTLNNRYYKTHSGAWVYVTKGTYGNRIDVSKEEEWFSDFVKSDSKKASRTPVYLNEAKYKEKDDFGDTFIEVSLDEQTMWYYVDGEIYVETPVTTGSIYHGGTDPRVCFVYSIIPNKWLNGPTWHNFVQCWVAIDGSIGIHDASWRSVYGGTEYIYNGSHGCVNTPKEAMLKLFDRVELGTPVIVYSLEKNGVESRD